MNSERRIKELTAQADDAGLMSDFLAGRLVRGGEQAGVSELPVPEAVDRREVRLSPDQP